MDDEAVGRRPQSPLTRGTLMLVTSYAGTSFLGLLSGVALARGLGPDQRGVMQYAILYFAVVPLILGLSLGTVFATYGRGEAVPFRGFWAYSVAISLVAALGAVSLSATGLPPGAAVALAVGALAYMTSDALVGLATRSGRFAAIARIRWFNLGGNSVIVIALYLAGILSVTSGVLALVAVTVLVTAVGWQRQPRPGRTSDLWTHRRQIANVHGVRLAATASTYLDQVLVAVSMSSATLGVYTVALSLARQISIVPAALQTVLLEAARRDDVDGRRRLESPIALLLWGGVITAVITLFFGPAFFSALFGADFRTAGTYAAGLVVTGTLAGVLIIIEAYLTGMHQPAVALRARMWSLPIVLVASVVSILAGSIWLIIAVGGLMNVLPLVLCARYLARSGRIRAAHCVRLPSWREFRLLATAARPAKNG